MQLKKNKSEVKAMSDKGNSNKNLSRNLLLILGSVVIISIIIAKCAPLLYQGIFAEKISVHKEKHLANDIPSQVAKEKALERKNDVKTSKAEQDSQSKNNSFTEIISIIKDKLPNFAPSVSEAESAAGSFQNDEEKNLADQNPYEAQVEKELLSEQNHDHARNQAKLSGQLNNYRLFLANANSLITRYKEDRLFNKDLMIFNSIDHPQVIKNILTLMEDYNQSLLPSECQPTDKLIEFLNRKPLNRFIKITPILEISKSRQRLKEGVDEALPILINYIYSLELQENFIKIK